MKALQDIAPKLLLMLALLALPAWFLLSGGLPDLADDALEEVVRERMPYALELERLGLDLRLLGGEREQNGIFISENGLMRNIAPPVPEAVEANARAITEFAQRLAESGKGKKSAYLAIIPTASGVLQQNLPRFARQVTIDQQRQIEEMYNAVSDTVRTVDVFWELENRRDQYLYYRTDSNLTALGGFYAYTAIARRIGITNRSLGQFDIEYVDRAYYGDLYRPPEGAVDSAGTAPYRRVEPDTISLFHFSGNREYVVTQRGAEGERVYHTLYPEQRMELGSKLDVYLGGDSEAVTEIRTSAPYRSQLLVVGDRSALVVLPFLANHYRTVTLANLSNMTRADFVSLQPERYDSVLFVYGIETYLHTKIPAFAANISWTPQESARSAAG